MLASRHSASARAFGSAARPGASSACCANRCAVAVSAADRRSIFAIPRGEVVYLGTTDTSHGAGARWWPEVERADVAYLLEPLAHQFHISHGVLLAGLVPVVLRLRNCSGTAWYIRRCMSGLKPFRRWRNCLVRMPKIRSRGFSMTRRPRFDNGPSAVWRIPASAIP